MSIEKYITDHHKPGNKFYIMFMTDGMDTANIDSPQLLIDLKKFIR